jgi:hypothetical protein
MVNRTQKLVLGFFVLVVATVVAIRVAAPEVYEQAGRFRPRPVRDRARHDGRLPPRRRLGSLLEQRLRRFDQKMPADMSAGRRRKLIGEYSDGSSSA